MQIECPECAARYEVPQDRLVPGRAVRCARCGRDWVPMAPEPVAPEPAGDAVAGQSATPARSEPVLPAAPETPLLRPVHPFLIPPRSPVSSPLPPHAPVGRSRGPISGLAIGWVVTVAVLLLAGWGVVEYRVPITRAWPPSQRVYDAVRLRLPAD